MHTRKTRRETPASNKHIAQRIAELERRLAVHDEILNFLTTILEQLKESGYRLVLTDAQRAESNRWLDRCERNLKSRLRPSAIN